MFSLGIIGCLFVICSVGVFIEYLRFKYNDLSVILEIILVILSGIFQILMVISILIVMCIMYIPLAILRRKRNQQFRE